MDSIARKEKRRNYKSTDSCIVCAGRQGRRKEGMPHGMFKRMKNDPECENTVQGIVRNMDSKMISCQVSLKTGNKGKL